MDSSSVCEKTRIELVVENTRTTLKNSPFDMAILALKQVEKTSEMDGEN